MCYDCDYRIHSVDMLLDLKQLNIKDTVNFHKMCFVYKCRNGPVETFSNVSDKQKQKLTKI